MRNSDELRNVLELFNNANQERTQDTAEARTRTEAVLNALQWAYWEDMPNSVVLQWLPSDPVPATAPEPSTEPAPEPGTVTGE